jgi:hypothetical protein
MRPAALPDVTSKSQIVNEKHQMNELRRQGMQCWPCWFDNTFSVGAVSPGPDKLDIFEHNVFGYVYWASWLPGNRWQDWFWLNGHRSLPTSVTAVSRSAGKIDLFVVDDHNHLETAAWDSAGGWRGWQTIGDLAVLFSGRPNVTAVSRSTDKLDVFAAYWNH